MAVRKLRPLSNSRRNTILTDYRKVLKPGKPPKSLLKNLKNTSGRDNSGQISVRHRGGRSKRKYRIIDFKRNKLNIFGKVTTREYDPNRNCFISLVVYPDGDKRYILSPVNLAIGSQVVSANDNAEINPGNAMPLEKIPSGTLVHNIELRPGQGGVFARAAGASAQILGFDETQKYVILKLASSETRKILRGCRATIGTVGNEDVRLVRLGKAGRQRWSGFRPGVRGAAMNRVDHPHGGGEGKAPIGHSGPRTKWGKKALGVKTRNRKLPSSKLILRRRKSRK